MRTDHQSPNAVTPSASMELPPASVGVGDNHLMNVIILFINTLSVKTGLNFWSSPGGGGPGVEKIRENSRISIFDFFFARINFREWMNRKNFAGINFREWGGKEYFAG